MKRDEGQSFEEFVNVCSESFRKAGLIKDYIDLSVQSPRLTFTKH